MTRKTTEALMLEVHSKLTNGEVAERKAQLLFEFSPNAPSNEAMIEIIAKEIGIEMETKEERIKMENEKEVTGSIESKSLKEGVANGKQWKRWTYKISGSNLTFATFTEYTLNVGDNVKAIYVDKTDGANTYHNIVAMDKTDKVTEELIKEVPKEVPKEVKPVQMETKVEAPKFNNSLNVEYFEDLNGTDLVRRVNEFGKTHSISATQTHVFGSYNIKLEPENRFCAFVWWR